MNDFLNFTIEELDFLLGLKAKIEIDGEEQIITRISPELTRNLIAKSQEVVQLSPEDSEEIISQLPASSYIQIFQFSDGKYGLHLKTRLLGGGFWGGMGGFLLGKTVVHIAGQAVIWGTGAAVGVFCPPLAAPVIAGMQYALVPSIEVASNTIGLGTAVIGMVATGPV